MEKLAKLSLIITTSVIFSAAQTVTSGLEDAGDDLSQYQIKFIENEHFHGSFVLTEGLVIPEEDSFYEIPADNLCQCRSACRSYVPCQAASAEPFGGRLLCRLSLSSPGETDLKVLQNASYFFFTSAISNRFYGIQTDGFLYVFANFWGPFPDSSDFCKKIPGHRLGLYGTDEQVQAITDLFQLVEDKDNQQIWTDRGDDGKKEHFRSGTFASDQRKAYAVCQADPLGKLQQRNQSAGGN
ncbi:uncharacterized protein [Macrobrachium rosenbergii]|uniref:uncharacterized protein n=1 Tax=Macrobrachium rosenbergii TaxID=79674 RepID=UPI0034D62F37